MEQILRVNKYFRDRFGSKIYKIALNGGMTCPNRDGKISTGGCIFCSEGGSGDFAPPSGVNISEQIETSINQVSAKIKDGKYIAYFQAYTNTYAPVEYLRSIFYEAIKHPAVVGISIATRPDCLPSEVLELLDELNHIKPVFIELGFQTSNEQTAHFINRGYDNSVFDNAVRSLSELGIEVIAHVIIGLPSETSYDVLNTITHINSLPVNGIKLQLMHILKHTALEKIYADLPDIFHFTDENDYIWILGECIEHLRPDIVIHRLTGDGPKKILIAPTWSSNKKHVLNTMNNYFNTHNITQGRKYITNGT
ncbi:MAG: TIGR01212 family radical SAM protein [Lachnospiraceae bacterium]|nr:TIGR01212 family radical SAM protein [Lachnospiraceae bacterium]MDD6858526.1 TIGR01212 family radical SAM protein [Lachnospiraceae bacterium]